MSVCDVDVVLAGGVVTKGAPVADVLRGDTAHVHVRRGLK